jgi:predicted transcriptional regulator
LEICDTADLEVCVTKGGGARPSSGAATHEFQLGPAHCGRSWLASTAAPEDGRAPSLTHYSKHQKNFAQPIALGILAEDMSAQEIIEQIKSLPPTERAAMAKFVAEQDDSWIPDDFKEAMKDAEAGRFVDMEKGLSETPPARLQ